MEQLWFTALLNRLFGGPVLSLLLALGIHPKHPAAPISNSFAMEFLVVVLLTLFFIAVRARLSVDKPGGLQHTMEGIEGFIGNMGARNHRPSLQAISALPGRARPVHSELQSDRHHSWLRVADRGTDRASGLRAAYVVLLPLSGTADERTGILQTFHGPGVVACAR